jgi:hypothetical protein
MSKSRKQYLETFEENKNKFAKDVESWTDEELLEYKKVINGYYNDDLVKKHKLGDFSHDKENIYYWHTLVKGADDKLRRRTAIGWSHATIEDLEGSGLEGQTIDGSTAVTMSHGSTNAVLLKIPRKLYDLSQKFKEKARAKELLTDYKGNEVKQRTSINDSSIDVIRDEGSVG